MSHAAVWTTKANAGESRGEWGLHAFASLESAAWGLETRGERLLPPPRLQEGQLFAFRFLMETSWPRGCSDSKAPALAPGAARPAPALGASSQNAVCLQALRVSLTQAPASPRPLKLHVVPRTGKAQLGEGSNLSSRVCVCVCPKGHSLLPLAVQGAQSDTHQEDSLDGSGSWVNRTPVPSSLMGALPR